jgi:hypothetical protein
MERTIKELESQQLVSLSQFDTVSLRLQEIEANRLDDELTKEIENAEILALREQCSRQESLFKEKFQSELNRVKSEYSADKIKLVKEIEKLADKAHELQVFFIILTIDDL